MKNLLETCLYNIDKNNYSKVSNKARMFNAVFNGMNIVQDDIFNVIKNYGEHNNRRIEILRYPIKNQDFYACTFIRKGIIFIVVNSALFLSKQIFATAHELYHIIAYIEKDDTVFLNHGSILNASSIDEKTVLLEDRQANAFAGLFLVPSDFLIEQASIYNIYKNNIEIKDILKLMDIFAIPYKAMVLRLFEDGFIDRKKTNNFLNIDYSIIESEINLTGISKRWQKKSENLIELGNLEEYIFANEKMGYVVDDKLYEDKLSLELIKEKLKAKEAHG